MSSAPVVSRKFVKKGSVVIVKTNVSDTEINSMELVRDIAQIQSNIDQVNSQIDKLAENKVGLENNLSQLTGSLNELMKFQDWAINIQGSKVRSLVKSLMKECVAAVEEAYVYDDAMTVEQNNITKYQRLQREIGTRPEVRDSVSKEVIHDKLFNNCIFDNPWA